MTTLLCLVYASICIVLFRFCRVPLTKWTVTTAAVGGVVLVGGVVVATSMLTWDVFGIAAVSATGVITPTGCPQLDRTRRAARRNFFSMAAPQVVGATIATACDSESTLR